MLTLAGVNSKLFIVVGAAALAVKKIMERDGLPGTLKIWPGIAEEQLGFRFRM